MHNTLMSSSCVAILRSGRRRLGRGGEKVEGRAGSRGKAEAEALGPIRNSDSYPSRHIQLSENLDVFVIDMERQQFKCKKCGDMFDSSDELNRHKEKVHGTSGSGRGKGGEERK
jgi:uncharacterized C2H2 Zn-finger protein